MTKTPLTPNDIEPRLGVVLVGHIPKTLQLLRILPRSRRVEILERALEKSYALALIADPSPPFPAA